MINHFFKFSKSQLLRLKKNFFSRIGSESAQILTQILYPPLMILFWGVDKFGIWIFLLSVPTMLMMFNFNFTDASIQEMTIYHEKKQIDKVKEIFQNTLNLIIINLTLVTILIILYFFLFDIDFSATKNLPINKLNIILLLIIISIYIDIFNNTLIAAIWFQGKQYISVNTTTAMDILSKTAIILSGVFFDNLIYAACIFLVFTVFKTLILYYYFKVSNKYLNFSLKKVSSKVTLKLFKLSIGHFTGHLSNIIKHSGLIVLIGSFFSPYVVAYISTAKTLFYFFPFRFVNILINISLFEYAQTFAKKKIATLKHNHNRHIIMTSFFVILFIIGSLTLGPFIYKLWLGKNFHLEFILLLFIVFDISLYLLKDSFTVILRSLNYFFLVSVIDFIIVLICLLISYYFFLLGYSFLASFIIIFIGTFFSLLISIYLVTKFYKERLLNI